MVGFLKGFEKLGDPFCCILGIAAICACVWLQPLAQILGIVQPTSVKAQAFRWAAVPKTTIKGKVVQQGIMYTGGCSCCHSKRIEELVGFKGTLGPCEINGSGAACSSVASEVLDKVSAHHISTRRLYSTAMHRCKNAYVPWFKIDVPHKGLRCAFRFGVEKVSEVTGLDALQGSDANNAIAHILKDNPENSTMTAWVVKSSIFKDSDATIPDSSCVVGFDDAKLLTISAAKSAETDERTLCLMQIGLVLLAVVFFGFGAMAIYRRLFPYSQVPASSPSE